MVEESEKLPPSGNSWEFWLSNIKLMSGECSTTSDGGKTKAYDSVEFTVANRTWRLTDVMMVKRREEQLDLGKPFLSGRLTTSSQPSDSPERMCELVDDMGYVLSIAMSRTVSWTSCALLDADGTKLHGSARQPHLTPFGLKQFEPITNLSPGSLQLLLERAVPKVEGNREWFRRTLDLVLQAQLHEYYEVRCSILFMLLDRLSSQILGTTNTVEIDAKLEERANDSEFKAALHSVLNRLSPENWPRERTEAVIAKVKEWNSGPSYAAKIKRACKAVQLPEPGGKLLNSRHALLHAGDLKSKAGSNYALYLDVDNLVLTMTLRLLSYEGKYLHPSRGEHPVPILAETATE